MGTMVDYAYRFAGSPKAIASARAAIEALQAKYADVSGNGNCEFGMQPTRRNDASLSWRCYATGDIDDFEEGIAELARNSDLRCHAYWGCTDGQCSSALNYVARGKWEKLGYWAAEIGIEAALAIGQLSEGAHVEALLALVDAVRVATNDGWDDERRLGRRRLPMASQSCGRRLGDLRGAVGAPRVDPRREGCQCAFTDQGCSG